MKAYVQIHSTRTIMVTGGLQNEDVTNKDAHVPDRLKVLPTWQKLTIKVRQGQHWYPSEITQWATVKALAKDKILTIGEFANEPTDNVNEVITKKDELNAAVKEVLKEEKAIKLADIVEEK